MCHIGDNLPDTAQVAMGYSPAPEKPSEGQSWDYPIDAVFIQRSAKHTQIHTHSLSLPDFLYTSQNTHTNTHTLSLSVSLYLSTYEIYTH